MLVLNTEDKTQYKQKERRGYGHMSNKARSDIGKIFKHW